MMHVKRPEDECTFSMAPFNPNVNGIFYEINSHRNVLNKAMSNSTGFKVYDMYKSAGNATEIGIITNISTTMINDNGTPKIVSGLVDIKFTTPQYKKYNYDEYVCGFAFEGNGDKNTKDLFILTNAEYAVLIHKDNLKGGKIDVGI